MSQKIQSKVSVVVAVYNIEKYIAKCIESIINQTYSHIEIILVDDCSTDSSGKICDTYEKKDNRIVTVHHERNKRQSLVRNTGLDCATGEYIVFVDGDDWLAPDFVAYMLQVITETGADMAINLTNFTTRDMKQNQPRKIQIWSAEKATAELMYPHLEVGVWNKIYRKDFLEKHHLRFKPELFTAEGYRFISDAAQRANHVGVGCRKVYYYRLNNLESATTKYNVRQSEGALLALEGIERDLVIHTPYVMEALRQHFWLNHFWNLRQILALKLRAEKEVPFAESFRYVKKYAASAAKAEAAINKKLKYYFAGMFPVLAARLKNIIFDLQLKQDYKKFQKLKEEI